MKSTKLPPPPLLLLFLTFILTFSLLPTAAPADANPTDAAALVAFKTALPGRWNTSASNACNWQGVVCNPQGRVTQLHLPGIGFIGRIPNNVLGNLSSLNFLSLRYNALSGNIPSDFASLSQLRYLYLQHNNLSGEIPAVLFSMKNLFRLDLAGNRFSGEIPLGFNNLTSLATLYLQSNQLTGSIPDLKITNLRDFNVSHNLLTGSIPSQFCKMPSTAFEGNSLSSCAASGPSAGPDSSVVGGADAGGENKKKKLSAGAIAGIIIGCVIALLLILLLIFCCCCRKKKKTEQQPGTRSADAVGGAVGGAKQSDVETGAAERASERNGESSGAVTAAAAAAAAKSSAKSGSGVDKTLVFFGNGPRVFDLDDLLRASAEVLGKGNYGTTYKASLDNGVAVAVKRLKDVTATEKEFREKLEEIGRLEHENLVGLRAYHCSANEKLLVYDYFPMGSLSALLHGNRGGGRTPLNWETRSAIALGAARGITYVHSQNSTASHGNIKSSNILLTNSYEARVSDCGLAQLATIAAPNRVAGYRAPEVTDTRRVSQKADVYSFGIFLLELLTGKAPTHALLNEEGVDLPRWVQSVVREEWAAEVFDMELLRYQNVEEEMVKLLQLAIDCCAQYPDSRPSMGDVTSRIEEICQSTLTSGQDPLADIVTDPENTTSKLS